MKVETGTVTILRISEVPRLDPIRVTLDNGELGKGRNSMFVGANAGMYSDKSKVSTILFTKTNADVKQDYRCETCGSLNINVCRGIKCFARHMQSQSHWGMPTNTLFGSGSHNTIPGGKHWVTGDSPSIKSDQKEKCNGIGFDADLKGDILLLLVILAIIALFIASAKIFGATLGLIVTISMVAPWVWLAISIRKMK